MKQSNSAMSGTYWRKLLFVASFLAAFSFAQAQCPIPFPKGDIDSTSRNVPVATMVTRNDITYNGSGQAIHDDSLSIASYPAHGTVQIVQDSIIIYTPNPGYVGNDYYTYTLCNSCGNCAQASVSIEVKPYCPAPIGVADHYTVYNNVANTLNVAANDVNVAGGPLTVSAFRNPHHGSLTLSGRNLVYNAFIPSYVGLDTFTYRVCDTCQGGGNCDTAKVYLNVITCQPVSAANDTFNTMQQSTITGDLAVNDQNASGFGNVTITLLTAPRFGGSATISGTTITYTAGSLGFGTDSVKYQICTDCGCDTAYAIIHIAQKPCAQPRIVADRLYTGYSVFCTTTFNITANDTIPINGGTLSVTIVRAPTIGTAAILANNLVYTSSDSNTIGQSDTIIYSLCNACYCDTGMAVLTHTAYPCNGLPPVLGRDTVHVCRNYSVTFNPINNDYSPQMNLVVHLDSIIGQGGNGSVTKNGNTTTYTPNFNFDGHDTFVYRACDNGNPSLCTISTVDVFVDPCSSAPIILNTAGHEADTLHVTVLEDSFRTYCFDYTQADSPYVYISHVGPSGDTVVPTPGSTNFGTTPCIKITPPTGSRSEQTVEVIICNKYPSCDTVVVYIDVIPVNHAPVAQNDALSYVWPGCDSINVLRNDHDVDQNDHLTITHYDSVTAHGGHVMMLSDSSFCYTADSSFTGIDSVAYTVCDTSHACTTAYVIVSVPIMARNDEATINQDQVTVISVRNNDTRATGEYVILCSSPQHGTAVVVDTTQVQYTPAHDYPVNPLNPDTTIGNGQDSFCYTLCHVTGTDTSCSTAMVYVTITAKKAFNIPQGISPNGDGVNDKFVINSVDEFPKSQLVVYNRYGDEVWRNDGDGYLNDFDGTWKKNGEPLPDGSYWYIFKFNDGVNSDRMGYIVIQR